MPAGPEVAAAGTTCGRFGFVGNLDAPFLALTKPPDRPWRLRSNRAGRWVAPNYLSLRDATFLKENQPKILHAGIEARQALPHLQGVLHHTVFEVGCVRDEGLFAFARLQTRILSEPLPNSHVGDSNCSIGFQSRALSLPWLRAWSRRPGVDDPARAAGDLPPAR